MADKKNIVRFWRCGTCGRYCTSELEIQAHQSVFSDLHAHDPEIPEHDGAAWKVIELGVGGCLEYCERWARLVDIASDNDDDDDDEPLIVETMLSLRSGGRWRMSHKSLAEHLTGSSEATEEAIRSFAAAIELGIDTEKHPDVDLDRHVEDRWRHWRDRDPRRAAVELAKAQLMLAVMTFNEARRKPSYG